MKFHFIQPRYSLRVNELKCKVTGQFCMLKKCGIIWVRRNGILHYSLQLQDGCRKWSCVFISWLPVSSMSVTARQCSRVLQTGFRPTLCCDVRRKRCNLVVQREGGEMNILPNKTQDRAWELKCKVTVVTYFNHNFILRNLPLAVDNYSADQEISCYGARKIITVITEPAFWILFWASSPNSHFDSLFL